MTRRHWHLIRLGLAAALLYTFAFAGGGPASAIILLIAVGFEVAFWIALFGHRRGHGRVQVDTRSGDA